MVEVVVTYIGDVIEEFKCIGFNYVDNTLFIQFDDGSCQKLYLSGIKSIEVR